MAGTTYRSIRRRDFLKFCAGTATVLGLPPLAAPRIAAALEKASRKPAVLWLSGQECTGCTISLINSTKPGIAEVVLDTISLRYHEAIMAASGHKAEEAFAQTIKEKGYIVVVEGSIPSADDRFCMVGGKPFVEKLGQAAKNCAAIIAVGACASYGGIPRGTPSKGQGVQWMMNKGRIPNKPVINLPTCPAHVDHMIGTIAHYLLFKKVPSLDKLGRPQIFFGQLVHDNCGRRGQFEKGNFLADWNDPAQKDFCLYLKGCKGPFTHADCPTRNWSSGLTWCIGAGAPCQGCSEPSFYTGMSPLYANTRQIAGADLGTVGSVMTIATAAGVGAHLVGQAISGRLGKGGPRDAGEKGGEA